MSSPTSLSNLDSFSSSIVSTYPGIKVEDAILSELVGTHAQWANLRFIAMLRLLPCCPYVQLDGLVRKAKDITEREAHSREMIV